MLTTNNPLPKDACPHEIGTTPLFLPAQLETWNCFETPGYVLMALRKNVNAEAGKNNSNMQSSPWNKNSKLPDDGSRKGTDWLALHIPQKLITHFRCVVAA